MRKRTIAALVAMLLGMTLLFSPAAQCSGCNQTTKDFCTKQSTDAFMQCILTTPYDSIHCHIEAEETYDACMLVMGCPQPPRYP